MTNLTTLERLALAYRQSGVAWTESDVRTDAWSVAERSCLAAWEEFSAEADRVLAAVAAGLGPAFNGDLAIVGGGKVTPSKRYAARVGG
jgi:hypothetical protein